MKPPRIAVLVKQVLDPGHFHRVCIDLETNSIQRQGMPSIMNPHDRVALEVALGLKPSLQGASVAAVSMGPPSAMEVLEEALVMGADQAYLLSDRAFAGADTLATARCLARFLEKHGPYLLVLAGSETLDGATAQVPPQVAEFLGVPHVTLAQRLMMQEGCLLVERRSGKARISLRMVLPGLVSVLRQAAEPRIPSALDILRGSQKSVVSLDSASLDLAPGETGLAGSPTRVRGVRPGTHRKGGQVYSGDAWEAVGRALERLKELGAL
ncbi:MAG: electron transfer flavoprotein subunit beta/FixA family protein [Bacillota bacterium]